MADANLNQPSFSNLLAILRAMGAKTLELAPGTQLTFGTSGGGNMSVTATWTNPDGSIGTFTGGLK